MKTFLSKVGLVGVIVMTLFGQTSIAQEALEVGDQAPDFVAESLDGQSVKLSDRFGKSGHPTVLLFSRANW